MGAFLTLLCAMILATPAAVAQEGNPHFIGNLTKGTLSGADLVVNFKEAGLSSGAVETITVTATVTENWFCVNRGSAHPQASNKRTSVSTVSVSDTFTADKNGNVIGSLTIAAPSAPSDFSCPSGQTLELGSITYSDVTITDETSGATFTIGTVSSGCLLTGVRFNKVSCT
jgi:hypothetical protein